MTHMTNVFVTKQTIKTARFHFVPSMNTIATSQFPISTMKQMLYKNKTCHVTMIAGRELDRSIFTSFNAETKRD